MKHVILIGCLLTGLLLASAVPAQDFSSLLDAVEKIETNLQAMVEKEAEARTDEMAKLRIELKALKGAKPAAIDNSEVVKLAQAIAELSEKVEILQALPPTGPAGTEDLVALTSEVTMLRAELDLLKNGLDSQVGPQLASNNGEAYAYAFGQQASPIEAAPAGIEFSGFIDVVASQQAAVNDQMNYGLGQAELDLGKEISDHANFEMAIAYNSDNGAFELGAAFIDIHLISNYSSSHLNQSGGIDHMYLTVGQFDVPFGIDFHEYASVDNKLISGPAVVHYTHEGWNDVGFQIGMEASFGNMVLFFVNGFEASAEIIDAAQTLATGTTVLEEIDTSPAQAFGARVGVSPLSHLEIGTSFATGINDASQSEMVMLGADIQWAIAGLEIKGEYIHHSVNRSIAKENNQGYYVQGLYNFGKIYAVSRFGSFKPYESNWSNQFSIGGGYALIEDVELRFESLIDQHSDNNANMLQLVAGF